MLIQVCMLISTMSHCLCVDLTYYVEEGKSPGTYLGDIAADSGLLSNVDDVLDHNLIRFSQLKQSVTALDGSRFFHISEKTGKLYTSRMLDAESMCLQNVECFRIVDIAIQQTETFMKILEIKVGVVDVNDHRPEFPEKQMKIEFSEDDKKGRRRKIPNAIDNDVGDLNSKVSYQLKMNTGEPFTLTVSKRVDGTSELGIYLKDNLDREVKDTYDIQVIAKDHGFPSKQNILNVRIKVVDVNDNSPVFSQNIYNVSVINEQYGNSPVIVLSASDEDSGKNGEISYHFSSMTSNIARTHFNLNKITGEIFLQKMFISGQKLIHRLFVEAKDGGNPSLSSIAMVLVNVISRQNNAPRIDVNFVSSSTGNTATISEKIEVGSFIAYIKITDNDIGPNGDVVCNFSHDKFQLKSLGPKKFKVIIKNPVDREMCDHYDIIIVCRDKGIESQQAKSKFSIQVTDVNDELPEFSKNLYKFWTKENERPNQSIGFISATDPDLGSGGQLTYHLSSLTKHVLPFQINNDGLISTKELLDREQQDIYKLQVLVKDNGTPSLNNTANVVVEVLDENDNAPYFTFPSVNPFSLDVHYDIHDKNNITVLKASDRDILQNSFLRYEIFGGNDKELFEVNHYTGLLSFAHSVDSNDAGLYNLKFVVKDSGTPVLSATTTLSLILTVSNKSSAMLIASQMQTEDTIDLSLLIITVLVAVIASALIAIPITICIIKCNDRRNCRQRRKVNPCNQCAVVSSGGMQQEQQQQQQQQHQQPATASNEQSSGFNEERSRNQRNTMASAVILETTEITRHQKQQSYEAKRQRKFLPEWKKTYPFIEYDGTAQLMYCKTCRSCPGEAMGNSLFHGVTGEKVRVRCIKDHLTTTAHRAAENTLQGRAQPESGPLVSAFDRVDSAITKKMLKLFNIAYFVAKEEAAFTMFPKLVALHHTNGLDLGTTYNNDQACRTFISFIGSCFIEEVREKIKSARFFSLVSDSSVDRSVKDQELIYCTYLQNGTPVNQLIGIVALDHAHSRGILDAILAGLLEVGVGEEDLKKRLVGFGCDGAAVMLGVNNGVTARLQRLCPSLVPIWCVAHRLELAALDCVKRVPQLQDIKQTLRAIHKHYTCSAKASRELQEIGKSMEISIVRPGNSEGTRWLPHMSHSLEALMRNFGPILVHFENHASGDLYREASAAMKGRAKLVLKSLRQYSMLLFIHFMLDVLQELKHLSLLFQKEGLTLQMVSDGLQTTKLAFVAMQTCVQQVAMTSGGGTVMAHGEVNELPMVSSHPNHGFSLSERNTGQNEDSGMSLPYRVDQYRQMRAMKILQRAFSCPEDESTNIKCFCKLNIAQNKELTIRRPDILRSPQIPLPRPWNLPQNESYIYPRQIHQTESHQNPTHKRLYRVQSYKQNKKKTLYKKHTHKSLDQRVLSK